MEWVWLKYNENQMLNIHFKSKKLKNNLQEKIILKYVTEILSGLIDTESVSNV